MMDSTKEPTLIKEPTLLEEPKTLPARVEVKPRWFYITMRGLLSLFGAGIGYLVASVLVKRGWFGEPINIVYITLVGLMIGYLLGAPVAKYLTEGFRRTLDASGRVPPQAVLAAIVGITVALIITVLLNSLLERVPGFTWYWSLLITLLLSVAFAWFFVVNRQVFRPALPVPAKDTGASTTAEVSKLKLIDTSAIIDGRIADIVEANFLDGTLVIPKFVLNELQNIADSSDTLRRGRGRRGLEVLDKLIKQAKIPTQVLSDDVPGVTEVDEKLIRLCQQKNAALITTDYNLNRVAALQNVRVLNVNQLANAVRAMYLPGERLSMHIVKEGREPSQGLAYLEDGTMVVVEDGSEYVGETIDVIVTSHLQTNMGRMIFAKPHQR